MGSRFRTIAGKSRHLHGYRRGFNDPRDYLFSADFGVAPAKLPAHASTRALYQPPVRDQGRLGSCTANAGCAAAGFLFHKQTAKPDPLFSRLMLYAQTRRIEGTPLTEDSGAYVRDVFKAMSKAGVCFEKTWPYQPAMFSRPPSAVALKEGAKHKALTYLRCVKLADIKASIAAGFPVIGGFTCFESLESNAVDRTGDVPLPGNGEAQTGGHCIYFDSYDEETRQLGFQNSWGVGWGAKGFGRLPYDYVELGLADDFWTVRKET